MKKEYIRTLQVFEDHFIEFKKTLSKDVLKKKYFELKKEQEDER